MASHSSKEGFIKPEDTLMPSDKELSLVGEVYTDFYKWRAQREGRLKQLQNHSLEDYLVKSRELFWNSAKTKSEDLEELGLDFQIGFIRKEALDFLGRLISLNIKPRPTGEGLDSFGVKVLEAIYKKWRMKTNDKVEKFWELLYAIVNGTVFKYIGWNDVSRTLRLLREYDPETGDFTIEEKKIRKFNDVWGEIVPVEDIFLPKLWERNIQKQGKLIWRTQVDEGEFREEFKRLPRSKFVHPGNRIAEDSLFFQLLSNTGITTIDKIEIVRYYDEIHDRFAIFANGIWLNPMGSSRKKEAPMPFNHKMLPFVHGIFEPIDEKFVYGMSLPFKIKDPHKILNTSYTMLIERELRTISPPVLSSDIESPSLIYGENRVIPVNDVNAYKEMTLAETSPQFFTMTNALQGIINTHAQGGFQQIAPSRQPRSAREVLAIENLKQLFIANTLVMYFNMLRQEIFLVLKTALQFYTAGRHKKNLDRIIRAFTVPNMSLTPGGIGSIKVRIVTEKQPDIKSFWEAIHDSVMSGRLTEIIEAPAELLATMDFEIDDIRLEQEKTSELEQAQFIEQVLTPMLQVYIPAGIADIGKVYLRHMEKLGEHPADYTPDQVMSQLYALWGQKFKVPEGFLESLRGTAPGGAAGQGQVTGALNQSQRGVRFGGGGAQGAPPGAGARAPAPGGAVPFGSQRAQPLPPR